jgi:ribonucleotide monophosphatase NagD (HAD superfamily)
VFIFDIDGTLRNGTEPIAGVTQVILELIKDESKHIFFYTNAGYCDRNTTNERLISFLHSQLDEQYHAAITSRLCPTRCYNSAYIMAHYLKHELKLDGHILAIGE